MYNGIGLATARGSGTNAYVQRNLSFVKSTKNKVEYRTEEDFKKLDAQINRPPNQEILDHQRKRQIEVKCLEMRELMEQQGYVAVIICTIFNTMLIWHIFRYDEEEIENKLIEYREVLKEKAQNAIKQKDWHHESLNSG